jgi:hypothetical protein
MCCKQRPFTAEREQWKWSDTEKKRDNAGAHLPPGLLRSWSVIRQRYANCGAGWKQIQPFVSVYTRCSVSIPFYLLCYLHKGLGFGMAQGIAR